MNGDGIFHDSNISISFSESSVHRRAEIVELVRHIARISAEIDYKTFLKSVEDRYSGPTEKGRTP